MLNVILLSVLYPCVKVSKWLWNSETNRDEGHTAGFQMPSSPATAASMHSRIQAEAKQADPVKESATRWHFKAASLSPAVDRGGTGQCQQCSLRG